MPYRCCGIIGCRNDGNTSVHQFPKNEPYRSLWCDSIGQFFHDCGIPWRGPSSYTSICEHHFGSQCFSRDPDLVRGKEKHRVRLKRDAVPTVFAQPDPRVINKYIEKCQAKRQTIAAGQASNSTGVGTAASDPSDQLTCDPGLTVTPASVEGCTLTQQIVEPSCLPAIADMGMKEGGVIVVTKIGKPAAADDPPPNKTTDNIPMLGVEESMSAVKVELDDDDRLGVSDQSVSCDKLITDDALSSKITKRDGLAASDANIPDTNDSNNLADSTASLADKMSDDIENSSARMSISPPGSGLGCMEPDQGEDLDNEELCLYYDETSKDSVNDDLICLDSHTVSSDEDGDTDAPGGLRGVGNGADRSKDRQMLQSCSPVCISSDDSHQSNAECVDEGPLGSSHSDNDAGLQSGDGTSVIRTPSPHLSHDHSSTDASCVIELPDSQGSDAQISLSGKRKQLDAVCDNLKSTGVGRVPMLGNIKVDLTLPCNKKKRKRTAGVSILRSTYQPQQNPYTQAHRKYLQSSSTSPPKIAAEIAKVAEIAPVPSSPVRQAQPLKLPSWSSSKLPTSALRGPPTVKVLLRELNPMISCHICTGYIVNATTLTECLHSFCRSCIIRHAYESLLCPVCKIMIHPSNPFQNMKPDSTMQDIVHRLVPHVEKDELRREEKFYSSQGIPYPLMKDAPPEQLTEKPLQLLTHGMPTWISILLEHAGTSPGCGPHRTLCKPYLRAPLGACVYHLMRLLCRKLTAPQHCKVVLFVDDYLLHESLTLEEVWDMFFLDEMPRPDIMHLQFGVVPDRDFFNDKSFKMADEPMEEFTYGVCAQGDAAGLVPIPDPQVSDKQVPDEYLDDQDVELFRHEEWMTS